MTKHQETNEKKQSVGEVFSKEKNEKSELRLKKSKVNNRKSNSASTFTKTPYLDKYTLNLTEKVSKEIDSFEAYGRDEEIRRIAISLLRLNKNSPCLVGEAGVGKTHIVEGFAAACIRKQVPKEFHNITVRSLSLGAIKSQTVNESGEVEDMMAKLQHIVEELTQYKDENILFVDEVHTIMGTSSSDSSSLDVANALKPALARGEIYFISATTYKEFTIIEKDEAMERRLQAIEVNEPARDDAVDILKKVRLKHQNTRGIVITDQAVEASVDLSIRYMADKQLPDKAIDLIDEATATAYLANQDFVDFVDVARLVSHKKGIPLDTIMRISSGNKLSFEDGLKEVVKGQDHAVKKLAESIYIGLTDMQNARRPLGSGMLLGTTGVGKTELARQAAFLLFGTEDALVRIDCTEYNTKDAIYRLIGNSETGEKGYLTERIKRNPYRLILFDELEKAHPDVHNLQLQILDDGRLTNSDGRLIDFKNTFILSTTNAGHKTIKQKYLISGDFANLGEQEAKSFMANVRKDLETHFRPEYLNRWGFMTVMNMLTEGVIEQIISSKMKKIEESWKQKQHLTVSYINQDGQENRREFYEYLKNVGTDSENGARPLERAINDILVAPIARQLYFSDRTPEDHYIAYIRLTGTPPKSQRNSEGRVSVRDKRLVTIEVLKVS